MILTMNKVCTQCHAAKDSLSFGKGANKDGLKSTCRACRKAAYQENKIAVSNKSKIFYQDNKDRIKARTRDYYRRNKDALISADKQFYQENKETILAYDKVYCRERRRRDPQYRLAKNLRTRLANIMSGRAKVGSAIKDLGCDLQQLQQYLASKFKPGMTWDNYGEWHIDHIRPLSKFNLQDVTELRAACHYTNLQPLWALDNLSKGNKS